MTDGPDTDKAYSILVKGGSGEFVVEMVTLAQALAYANNEPNWRSAKTYNPWESRTFRRVS